MADWLDEGLDRSEKERAESALRDRVRLHHAEVLKQQRPVVFDRLMTELEAGAARLSERLAERRADFTVTFQRKGEGHSYIHRDGDPTVMANISLHPQGISFGGHVSASVTDRRFQQPSKINEQIEVVADDKDQIFVTYGGHKYPVSMLHLVAEEILKRVVLPKG